MSDHQGMTNGPPSDHDRPSFPFHAVEAGARELHAFQYRDDPQRNWNETSPRQRRLYRERCLIVLRATRRWFQRR